MNDSYFTIAKPSETEIKIQASIFKATAIHVPDLAAAEAQLAELRKRYHDATHNCYAWLIDEHQFRYSDDGEPNQSAGKPIFDVIKGSGLQELLLVVTRYFGGTKLGVGGLVRAYSEATKLVLDRCERREIVVSDRFHVTYAYDDTNIIMHELEKVNGKIISNRYDQQAEIEVDIRKSLAEQFSEELITASNGRIAIQKITEN